jgi:anti-anti-sigma factor
MRYSESQPDEKGCVTLKVDGSLTHKTAPDFIPVRDNLALRLERGEIRGVIIDCGALLQIDTVGVEILFHLYRRSKACGGSVSLANVNGQARSLLRLLHLDKAEGFLL